MITRYLIILKFLWRIFLTTFLHLMSIENSECIQMTVYKELALELGLIFETNLGLILC